MFQGREESSAMPNPSNGSHSRFVLGILLYAVIIPLILFALNMAVTLRIAPAGTTFWGYILRIWVIYGAKALILSLQILWAIYRSLNER